MNKSMKVRILAIFLILGIAVSGFAFSVQNLKDGVDDFSGALALSLPLNASLGLNWSDAYIGKFFPSLPPHFGIGGSFGITTMKLPIIKSLMGYLGYSLPFDIARMIFPAYAAEARLGGLFLPFDIGVKFGYLPPLAMWGTSLDMNYLLVGADLRYSLVNIKILKLSAGVGVNYLKGSLGAKVANQSFDFGGETLTVTDPKVALEWNVVSVDFKAQLSFSLLILTPYVGLGASYAKSSAGYTVNATDVNYTGFPEELANYLTLKDKSISSIIKNDSFSIRAFGGFSLNLALFKIDFTGLYSFRDQNLGGSVGFRFQL